MPFVESSDLTSRCLPLSPRTRRARSPFAGMMVLAVAGGCSPMWVNVDYDAHAKFSELKTYDWHEVERAASDDERLRDPGLHEQIRLNVDRSLADRGYRRVASETPDFLVSYHVALRERLTLSTARPRYRYNPGYAPETYMRTYDEGALILEFITPGTTRVIWRGAVQAEIREGITPDKRAARIRKGVHKLLSQFPPPDRVARPGA